MNDGFSPYFCGIWWDQWDSFGWWDRGLWRQWWMGLSGMIVYYSGIIVYYSILYYILITRTFQFGTKFGPDGGEPEGETYRGCTMEEWWKMGVGTPWSSCSHARYGTANDVGSNLGNFRWPKFQQQSMVDLPVSKPFGVGHTHLRHHSNQWDANFHSHHRGRGGDLLW